MATNAEIKAQLLADLASRDLTVKQYRLPDGRWIECRSPQDLQDLLNLLDTLIAAESATANVAARRAYAVAGRR